MTFPTFSSCQRFSYVQVLKEKIFRRLYKELPYEVQIEDVSLKTLADGSLRIEKNLMVRTDQVVHPLSACPARSLVLFTCAKLRSMPLQLFHLCSKHDANVEVYAL